MPGGMKSSSDSLERSEIFTRLTATVTMSAPAAACACAMTAWDVYFPVPTINRDANVRPAMTNGASTTLVHQHHQTPATIHTVQCLASSNKIHNLDAVTVVNQCVREELSLENLEVMFDSHAARINRQLQQQIGNRDRLVEFVGFAVERDAQGTVAEWMLKRTARRADSQGKPLIQRGLRWGQVSDWPC